MVTASLILLGIIAAVGILFGLGYAVLKMFFLLFQLFFVIGFHLMRAAILFAVILVIWISIHGAHDVIVWAQQVQQQAQQWKLPGR